SSVVSLRVDEVTSVQGLVIWLQPSTDVSSAVYGQWLIVAKMLCSRQTDSSISKRFSVKAPSPTDQSRALAFHEPKDIYGLFPRFHSELESAPPNQLITMLNLFTPALLAISTISSTTATPLPKPPNATDSIITAPGFVPPEFSIQFTRGHERLDIDSAIMAITKTLYELSSSEDFLNDVIAPVTYFCRGYTSVAVTIRGVDGGMDVPVRYAVWGAVEIGRTMVHFQQIHNHTFALRWRETVVGLIDLVKTPGPGQPSLARTTNSGHNPKGKNDPEAAVLTQLLTTTPQTPDPTAMKLPLSEEREITISIQRKPDMPFSKWDLFSHIWDQLLYVNSFPPRQVITSEWVIPRGEAKTSFTPSGPPFDVEYRD
ncbi:MAG: hypothetical protein Q9180_008365, partial [Flavoplaca navasiana]